MRKEEILSLEWEKNIDLTHGFILLTQTKNGERREVPINATLRTALQVIVRRLDSPYVFVDGQGRRYKDVKRSFGSALRKTGIKDFRFHDLRHSYASWLIGNGESLAYVKEQLGHSSIKVTVDIYGHLVPGENREAADRVADRILSPREMKGGSTTVWNANRMRTKEKHQGGRYISN